MNFKGAILVVSFGSSVSSARENAIIPIEMLIRKSCPDYYVSSAFTSNRVIKKLKETEGINIDTPEEGMIKLINQGYKNIIVQPLHIIAGYEFDKIKDSISRLENSDTSIKLGKPLLFDDKDFLKVIEGLKFQMLDMNPEKVVVLVGHGTHHPANVYYKELQNHMDIQQLPVIVGTIEEGITPILEKLRGTRYKEVLIIPFLLVAGDHVQNDLLGDSEESWRSIFINNGYEVIGYSKGLGENPYFQDFYLQRVKNLL